MSNWKTKKFDLALPWACQPLASGALVVQAIIALKLITPYDEKQCQENHTKTRNTNTEIRGYGRPDF